MMLDPGSQLLSDLVFLRTYAKTIGNKKERDNQTIDRVLDMHVKKFPFCKDEITEAFKSVHNRKVMPSMRSMQFAGEPIERSNCRIYNCAYSAIESFRDISDATWILMNGAGFGYSVQSHHVDKLPAIVEHEDDVTFAISDDKEGWANSILLLMYNPLQKFDYSLIRSKGSPLSTGGTASGPDSLQLMHEKVRVILRKAVGRKLQPIEVHDIMCHVGDVVLCGGVRRAALICLFDVSDTDMMKCKSGDWWVDNPQRGRANNSAVVLRSDPHVVEKMLYVLQSCFDNKTGEPGLFLTNDLNWGTNPCVEIGMRSHQFCNLTEINAAACKTREEFLSAVKDATIVGTLQASYTDFSYISDEWKKNCEEEALLGVSITGQAEAWELLTEDLLEEGAKLAVNVNQEWAKKIDINPAARIGCTKPSGSTSAFLGTTSGIHAAHSDYFIRRVYIDMFNPVTAFLMEKFGMSSPNSGAILERHCLDPDLAVVSIPVSKAGAIQREKETPTELLERAKRIAKSWIAPSHVDGKNKHNVSLTVSYKPEDERTIMCWMVDNRDSITGVSFLPFSCTTYQQMPFESISEVEYTKWRKRFPKTLNLFDLDFAGTSDCRKEQAACAGGACEITKV